MRLATRDTTIQLLPCLAGRSTSCSRLWEAAARPCQKLARLHYELVGEGTRSYKHTSDNGNYKVGDGCIEGKHERYSKNPLS